MGQRAERDRTAEGGVAVVGGGVVGLLTAWQLRVSGHRVTIVDPAPGARASYAAAGMLAPISEVQYGQQQLWELMNASNAEYPGFVASLESAARLPAGYRKNGTLLIAADPGDREAVAELVAVQQDHGMAVSPLTSRELRREEAGLAPGLAKAWGIPGDHQVNPRQLIRCATAALNAELGPAEFPAAGPPAQWIPAYATRVGKESPGSPRTRVEWASPLPPQTISGSTSQHKRPHNWEERAQDDAAGSAVFDSVALAPGLGYDRIAGIPQEHPLDLRPVHGEVLRLRVRDQQLAPGEEHIINATIRAKVRGRSVYLVPRSPEDPLEPRGLVVGASSREDDLAGTHAGSVVELLEDAAAVLPAVREMELMEITTRARPGTPDDRPYLGAVEEAGGVVISTGYHRHGILLAPLAARLTAVLLNGDHLSGEDARHLQTMSLGRHEGLNR